jgi:ATP-dependent helicase/nuclease subunit B
VEVFSGDILQAVQQGALVLTVNKRLAKHLRQRYDQRLLAGGRGAWRSPDIFALDGWLNRVAVRLGLDGRLLDQGQELRLWETVVEEDLARSGNLLMRPADAARQALRAHRLLEEYGADFRPEEGGEDHRVFLRWREQWLAACRAGRWDDPARLSERVSEALRAGRGEAPRQLVLAGFDEMTPAVTRLTAALAEQGCAIGVWQPAACQPQHVGLAACPDPAGEVRRCARWVRRLLEKGPCRIGIVAVGLEAYQRSLQRIFREELAPASLLPGGDAEKAFNLSLGTRLLDEGLVVAAFELLAVGRSVPLDRVSYLLRSPFVWGHLAEQHSRALFDSELRRLRLTEIPLNKIIRLAHSGFKQGLGKADLFARVLEMVDWALEKRGRHKPGVWARDFSSLLEVCRWPGDRVLDSRSFQVYSAWDELLSGMAGLDPVSRPMERSEALALLKRLAAGKIFQAEGSEGPVQVMGYLEAAGLEFDHLWILGMHEEALPPPADPNPFLPLSLQRRCGMPRADAARELEFSAKVAARLLGAAPEVVVSYPRNSEGRERQPSPLVRRLPAVQPDLAPQERPADLFARSGLLLETLVDSAGPPLAEGLKVCGGTAILKDQALCPFRAFARHRLHARGLDAGVPGLDNLERGQLVHHSLEHFWTLTGNSTVLHALDEQALAERIGRSVEEGLTRLEKDRKIAIPKAFRANEADRLRRLLREWFELERRRDPFEVECLEIWHREALGQLTIQTRLDRIDRLADGSRIILDYKTGRSSVRDWLGERPLEPQLPLYGLGRGGRDLAAVVFASVRSGNCSFTGFGRSEDLLPGLPAAEKSGCLAETGIADWSGLLAAWRRSLEGLSREFADGVAAVAPIDRARACDRCDLQAFCRIAEGSAARQQGEEE